MNRVPKRQTQFVPHSFGLVCEEIIKPRSIFEMQNCLQALHQRSRDVCLIFNPTINLRGLDYGFHQIRGPLHLTTIPFGLRSCHVAIIHSSKWVKSSWARCSLLVFPNGSCIQQKLRTFHVIRLDKTLFNNTQMPRWSYITCIGTKRQYSVLIY